MTPVILSIVCVVGIKGGGGAPTTTSAPAPASDAVDSLTHARQLAITGQYAEALTAYERAASEDGTRRLPAALGAAEVMALTGRYTEGLSRLENVQTAGKATPAWHLMRARLLTATGRYDEAIQACRSVMGFDLDNFEARYRCARLFEITGRRDRAMRLYQFFDRLAHERVPDRASDMVWHGLGFYRSTVLKRHPAMARRTRYVLHELFQPAYEVKDPQYWPARIASAQLLLSKYNLADAEEDFKAALAINPKLPVARAGLAEIALDKWKFETCEKHLHASLEVNPNHVPSRNVMVRLRLTERKFDQAVDQAKRALEISPNDLEALSLAAAAYVRLGDDQAAQSYEERARKINPRCALMHHTIAEWLSAGRQFPEAEERYRRAIELDPSWADPQTNLGLMYMQWGKEAEARKTLDGAWELDRFNRKTYNVLHLLEQIEGFRHIESQHFIVKFDAGQDAVLAPYFIEYLESILPVLCRDYGYTPKDKTIVEVFPSHRSFSVRITSKPWIHTIGACTGRVIALDAPRHGASVTGPFDWARVLRHELTHTVTLGATVNRIPHWFTEALAVRQETSSLSFDWMWVLSSALRRGRLFSLDTIDWSFIRPKRAGDRKQAYAQSRWMADFIVAEHGYDAIGKMLVLFRDQKSQAEVIRAVCGFGVEEFDKRFRKWATEQVRNWGLPVDEMPPIETLRMRVEKAPTDSHALAALAERLFCDGKLLEAADAAKRALEQNPDSTLALTVRCSVLMTRWQHSRGRETRDKLAEEVEPLAERLARLDPGSLFAPRYLAQLAMDREDLDAAEPWLKRLRRVSPHDPVAKKGLAALYLRQGQKDKAIAELAALAEDNEHEPDLPLQIAHLYVQLGHDQEAATWLERAVRIDPYDVETHEQLGGLSIKLGLNDVAIREYRSLCELDPTNAQHFARLAVLYKKQGQLDQARQAAERAVKLDPDSSVGRLLNSR